MKKFKTILVVNGFPTRENPGRGIFNYRAAVGLSSLVHLHVIFLRFWKPSRKLIYTNRKDNFYVTTLSLPVIPFVKSSFYYVFKYLGWHFIKKIFLKADIVHSVSAEFPGVISSYWSKKAQCKHVCQAIGSDINSVLPKIKNKSYIKNWECYVDGAITNSFALEKTIKILYPKLIKVKTAYRGTKLDYFHPIKQSTQDHIQFLFIGGLPPYPDLPYGENTKGGITIMKAWRKFEKELYKQQAILVFAGPYTDQEKVQSWRSSLQYPENVHIEGLLTPEQVLKSMQNAQVLLVPSTEEGLPNAGVEAAACGCAVLGSNVGGIPEIIENGETGFLLVPFNIDVWGEKMLFMSKQVQDTIEMGIKARERMEMYFDASNYPSQLVAFYQEVLTSSKKLYSTKNVSDSCAA